ncbi:WEB family protein At5g55860-like [Cryptomeria japonica]|uniref:WEB family protein At5g55860-like n=1 Tax=Cryptomeria japonica TaxID=3369 RepID=UPI0027DA8ECE|nr:WEB family protein At5g55860-like [Cryptomeria japonica]
MTGTVEEKEKGQLASHEIHKDEWRRMRLPQGLSLAHVKRWQGLIRSNHIRAGDKRKKSNKNAKGRKNRIIDTMTCFNMQVVWVLEKGTCLSTKKLADRQKLESEIERLESLIETIKVKDGSSLDHFEKIEDLQNHLKDKNDEMESLQDMNQQPLVFQRKQELKCLIHVVESFVNFIEKYNVKERILRECFCSDSKCLEEAAGLTSTFNENMLKKREKFKGATSGLSLALQQLASEAEKAKKEAEAMREEAQKARYESDQAKATVTAIENKLQDALKEAEAAKVVEIVAIERIKALSEKTNAARASTSDSGAGITISQDEHDSLNRRVKEADELADMKVGAAMAQVDTVKASEQEILKKLLIANREIEELKSVEAQALQKAEMAEAAKKAVKGELRRWREHEQRKRSVKFETAQELTNTGNNDSSGSFIQNKSIHPESLAKVLNIKIPSPGQLQGGQSVDAYVSQKKKKHLIPNIRRIFSRNKSQLNDSSLKNQF